MQMPSLLDSFFIFIHQSKRLQVIETISKAISSGQVFLSMDHFRCNNFRDDRMSCWQTNSNHHIKIDGVNRVSAALGSAEIQQYATSRSSRSSKLSFTMCSRILSFFTFHSSNTLSNKTSFSSRAIICLNWAFPMSLVSSSSDA
jgi:hypothetical protein